MKNIHEEFMFQALEEAKKAKEKGDWPFGTIIVKAGNVVGRGHAIDKSGGDVTGHAELVALRDACQNLKTTNLNDCSIYCSNEPCIMCAAAIFQANIGNVYIGISRGDIPHLLRQRNLRIEDLALDSGFNIIIQRDILKDKILSLFKDVKKK